ncbi:hypothetical protein HanXRQr2_Chr02g0054631 [Helianthus annuus]|uniref:Uncharacterized protein n=1 Tax=Helianthus annuus TaxID=4232 RepID=A0A9K3JLW9_HELAN|nr:hypothetical protein HanXRQr2_Chr02g0054631 [Helianthus annuus]KAJ0614388.1 hypothetical protein HanIR_Chr02g0061901 [Helianthus annuus]KAJ0950919.1 hypothetical protein HanPSC8_Chr02g0053941 [Helianthus annuus]
MKKPTQSRPSNRNNYKITYLQKSSTFPKPIEKSLILPRIPYWIVLYQIGTGT